VWVGTESSYNFHNSMMFICFPARNNATQRIPRNRLDQLGLT
jgi:hypothetical protein